MKKVLIITYAFPPLNVIASRRFSELAAYFPENGWQPFILTTESKGDLKPLVPDEQIFRAGNHPGLNSGVGSTKSIKNLIANARRKLGFTFRVFDSTLFNWSKVVLNDSKLIAQLKQQKFDLVLASYGPSSALRVGHVLSKKLDVPIVCDFRDLGALYEADDFKQNFIAKIIDQVLEKKYLSKAKALTTISHAFAEALKSKYKLDAHVIYNGWVEQKEIDKSDNNFDREGYVFYAGCFYEHRMDSMYLLLKALRHSNLYLKIRSLGPKPFERALIEKALEFGVEEKLVILDGAPAKVVNEESQKAKINLVVEAMGVKYETQKGVLTGKLLQLLVYSQPVLAIAIPDSEIGLVLNETEKGKLVSTESEIINFLHDVEEDSSLYKGSNLVAKYSKESQASKLCSILSGLLIMDK